MPGVALISTVLFAIMTSSGSCVRKQIKVAPSDSRWTCFERCLDDERCHTFVGDGAKRSNLTHALLHLHKPRSSLQWHQSYTLRQKLIFLFTQPKTDRHSLRHNRSKQDETPAGGISFHNHPLRPSSDEGRNMAQSPPVKKLFLNSQRHLFFSSSSLIDILSLAFLFIHYPDDKKLRRPKKWKPFYIWINPVFIQELQ